MRFIIGFLFIFIVFLQNSFAQKPDSLVLKAEKIDSVKKIVSDSIKKILDTNKVTFKKFVKVVFTNEPSPKKRPALKATYRSMVLPGWGQVTNKEYWVLPIIYSAAGVGVYLQKINIYNYNEFKDALTVLLSKNPKAVEVIYKGWVSGETVFKYEPNEQAVNTLKPNLNSFRRYRDLTWISFGLGWALQAVQANVSAHLKSFDMSEDISFNIQPLIHQGFGTAVGFKINANF